jgi:hypothetical protein
MARKRTEEEWEQWQFQYENKGSNSLQHYVLRRLEATPNVVVVKVMKANRDGVSDLLICANGTFVAIELKVAGGKPTILQGEFLNAVEEANGVAGVAYTWGGVKEILRVAGVDI